MDLDNIITIAEFDKQYGEVFLSIEGNLSFLCTLCGMKYKGYQAYADHIMETHYLINEVEDDESFHNSNDIKIEYGYQEIETVRVSEVDIGSPSFEDGFQLIEDVKFDAPVPDNCGEIEEFIAALRKTNVQNKMHTTEKSENTRILKTEKAKDLSPPQTSGKPKIPISNTRRYRCPNCNFVTKSYSTVMMHIARHLGQKRHFCEHCNKGFYTPNEVRVHTRIHTGERPYLCTECGQTFVTNSSLWRHTKSCKNIRDKSCTKCDMKFFDTVGLRNHMFVHTERRSHQCTKCDASFKLPKVLQNHMRIHENKQEFKCRYCPASFNQQPGLISHVKNKHFKGAILKQKIK